jgi:hypothetical protein
LVRSWTGVSDARSGLCLATWLWGGLDWPISNRVDDTAFGER